MTDLSLLSWFAANKDAMIAIAALLSPVIAVAGTVVAAIVSYRAVVTGPRIQREIAREQFTLTSRQVAVQERTVALTEAQISANLLGAADQKWIEDFREAIAELEGLVSERGVIEQAQKQTGNPSFQLDRSLELAHRIEPLSGKIRLMVGPAGRELMRSIRNWIAARPENYPPSRVELGYQVFDLAWQMIEQKQAGIAARTAAVERVAEIAETAASMPEIERPRPRISLVAIGGKVVAKLRALTH